MPTKQTKPDRSLFITFEGGEGAGKTTLIRHLEQQLVKNGHQVVITREPGGSKLGDEIRQILLGQAGAVSISPFAELLLFLADRAQHIEEFIRPALLSKKIVLCDRFNDSSVAYQGSGRGLGIEKVRRICDEVCGDVKPDLTFFLDLDPGIGFDRAKKERRVMDRMENEKVAFHEKVRQGFLLIAKNEKDRVAVLDASQTPEKVFTEALKILEKRLKVD